MVITLKSRQLDRAGAATRCIRGVPWSTRRILAGVGIAAAVGCLGLYVWRSWAADRRLLASSRVSVVEVRAAFPPALVVDFENAGEAGVERTHFRLAFEAEGREISRADTDVLNMQPGEKRRIVLRSDPSGPVRFHLSRPVPARYTLVVLPRWIRGLPVISGEFVLVP